MKAEYVGGGVKVKAEEESKISRNSSDFASLCISMGFKIIFSQVNLHSIPSISRNVQIFPLTVPATVSHRPRHYACHSPPQTPSLCLLQSATDPVTVPATVSHRLRHCACYSQPQTPSPCLSQSATDPVTVPATVSHRLRHCACQSATDPVTVPSDPVTVRPRLCPCHSQPQTPSLCLPQSVTLCLSQPTDAGSTAGP